MKFLFIVFTAFASTSHASVNKQAICVADHCQQAQDWVANQTNTFDKFKHCAVACYLSLRCPTRQVRTLSYAKELRDLLGYGNAEIADIKAGSYGIKIVKSDLANVDEDCVGLCNERYPQ